MCILNKIDLTRANVHFYVGTFVKILSVIPFVLQLLISAKGGFLGVTSLVTMEAVVWSGGWG